MLAGDEPPLIVDGVAVRIVGGLAEHRNLARRFDIAQHPVVGDVGPDEIAPGGEPGRAFAPARAGPQPLDPHIAGEQRLEARIEDDEVRSFDLAVVHRHAPPSFPPSLVLTVAPSPGDCKSVPALTTAGLAAWLPILHIAPMHDSPRSRLVAVLGPTNTGKTHLAVERMLAHSSGMIGLPLRLLAREIYDRVVKARGAARVALITGEEKIVPAHPQYFVCTVEAMPLDRRVEFLAVDEIQLCADPERGHVFTHRLLHARGNSETMLMGAATVVPLIRRLCPDAEIQFRERLSTLSYDGPKKLTRLPRRSAVVAFSADAVYAIAELIRRHRGGAAVVMGSLSPRTRNAQVELFQSGEVDFLVATDAIGMGLNMDVDHVAFAGLRKFDGRRMRGLMRRRSARSPGAPGASAATARFGVTGDAPDLDPDVVASVEGHVFPAGAGRRVAQRAARFFLAARAHALARRAAAVARPAALRGSPGRDDAAPAVQPTSSSSGARATAPICGGCGRPARRRTSARPARTSTPA